MQINDGLYYKITQDNIDVTKDRSEKASLDTILRAWKLCSNAGEIEKSKGFLSAWYVIRSRIVIRKEKSCLFKFFYWITGRNKQIDALNLMSSGAFD